MNVVELPCSRRFFPQGKISQVPVAQIREVLEEFFNKTGIPQGIRIDNGRPFADPQLEIIPVLSLWLTGLGIKVIVNAPRSPKQNAKVERGQGTMAAWVDPQKCKDVEDLQRRLDKESHFYTHHFPVRRLGKKTKIEAYPNLTHTGKEYDADHFQLQKVLDLLAAKTWARKVNKNGQITIYGHRFSVGMKHQKQIVELHLCPINNTWVIHDDTGVEIKQVKTRVTTDNIWQLNLTKK